MMVGMEKESLPAARSSDAETVRAALGASHYRNNSRALAALARMEALICDLLAEREFGPQPWACANPDCSLVSCGTGYKVCPKCGGPLVAK